MNFLSLLTATYPAMFGLLPVAIGGLFYAYLRFGKARQSLVPSLILMPEFSEKTSGKTKLHLPLRFFLELLAALLLFLALTRPFLKDSGQRIAVVIDNSLSMSAVSDSGKSVLQEGIALLVDRLSATDILTQFALFKSSPSLTMVEDNLSFGQMIDRVVNIKVTSLGSDLTRTLQGVVERGGYDKIFLLTDLQPEGVADNVEVLSVGSASFSNVAITEVSQEKEAEGRIIRVSLQRFSSSKEATSDLPEILLRDLRGRELERRDVVFSSTGDASVEFNSKFLDACQISFVAKGGLATDRISDDSTAFLPDISSAARIGVISRSSTQDLGLDGIRSVSAQNVDKDSPDIRNFDLLIVHHQEVGSNYKIPTLRIVGDATFNDKYIKKVAKSLDVTGISEDHPVTNYLRGVFTFFPLVAVLDPSRFDQSLIDTPEGSVFAAGSYNGVREVVSGFELLPFLGEKSAGLSVLLLNSIKWLVPDLFGGVLPIQQQIELREGDTKRTFIGIDGETVLSQQDKFEGERRGVLRALNPVGNRDYALFSFLPEESNLSTIRRLNLSNADFKVKKVEHIASSLFLPLLWTAFFVLVLELAFVLLGSSKIRGKR